MSKKKRWIYLFVAGLILLPIAYGDGIQIKNLGILGFNETNQEYTSLRTVILDINFSINATACRYRNNNTLTWTAFEDCNPERYWLLSSGASLKRVFVNINYTGGVNTTYNDTITYNYTGAGLDTSPPGGVTIYDGDYSNSNSSANFTWSQASDPESGILDIPLLYSYQVLVNSTPKTSWSAWSTSRTASFISSLAHNDSVVIIVNVSNSAELQSSTTSDGVIIDLINPDNTQISSSLAQTTWSSNTSIFFNWSSTDNLSGIGGFSYTFSTYASVTPDDVPEGPLGDLENHKNKTFAGVNTGKFKFRIKAEDKAGNWGNISSYEVWIDVDPPTKPEMTSAKKVYGVDNISFSWSESFDEHSGIANYVFQISNLSNFSNTINQTTLDANATTFSYVPVTAYPLFYGRVRAVDDVGNTGQWSNEETAYDTTPPTVAVITPSGNVDGSSLPIIAVETNEKSLCYYQNTSGGFTIFEFTNQTYHETKPRTQENSYTINCSDLVGNYGSGATGALAYLSGAPGSVTLTSASAYTGQIARINLTAVKGGIMKNRFTVTLAGRETDFTIVDKGDGDYLLNLIAPSTSGSYTLNVDIDGKSGSNTLTVSPLTLIATYSGTFSPSSSKRITYYTSANYTSGFASDSSKVELSISANTLSINSSYEGYIYFFATKKLQNIPSKENRMKEKTFLSLQNPSFGYPIKDYYLLNIILKYPGTDIVGDETINTGGHTLMIKSLKAEDKKRVLVTSKVSSYDEWGVISYD